MTVYYQEEGSKTLPGLKGKKIILGEILLFLLLFATLTAYYFTTMISVKTSSPGPEKLICSYNGQTLASDFKIKHGHSTRYFFFLKRTPPKQISFALNEETTVKRIKIYTEFSCWDIPRELIQSKISSASLCFNDLDFYCNITKDFMLFPIWLQAFILLILLFDICRRFIANFFQSRKKILTIFAASNCFIIFPLMLCWISALCNSHDYIRIIPEIKSNRPLSLQLFYTFGNEFYSESKSTKISALDFGMKQSGAPVIYLPGEAFWARMRFDFDSPKDVAVTIQKIEIFDRFTKYTIPGSKIPTLLQSVNEIKISADGKISRLSIPGKKDAYLVFSPEKICKNILPEKNYPWQEILFFFILEIFIGMLLWKIYRRKEHDASGVMPTLRRFFFQYTFLLFLFIVLRVLSAFLPQTSTLYDNMQKTALRGIHEKVAFGINDLRINNFSDISYYSIGYFLDPAHPVLSSMNCMRIGVDNPDPTKSFHSFLSGHLQNYMLHYRYWMGSTGILRFFSEFLTHKEIRQIFSIIILGLIAVLLHCIFQKLGLWSTVSMGLMLASLSVFFIHLNTFVYWPILIMLFLTGYLLVKKDLCLKDCGLSFFTAGAFCAFLDILTNPILALAVPGTVVMIRLFDSNKSFSWKTMSFSFGVINISWFAGYIMLWLSKWVIAILLFPGAMRNIIGAVLYRTSSTVVASQKISRLAGLLANIREFYKLNLPVLALGLILFAVMSVITFYIIRRYKAVYSFPMAFALIGFFALPAIWQIVTANHAFIHFWCTFRTLSGSFFAILLLPYIPLRKEKREEFIADFSVFLQKLHLPIFPAVVIVSISCIIATTVVTGMLRWFSAPRYKSTVLVENKVDIKVVPRKSGVRLKRNRNEIVISSPVSYDWVDHSFDISAPEDVSLKIKLGCKPVSSANRVQHYAVEYKQIQIDGNFYHERIRHCSSEAFPSLEIKLKKNIPARLSYQVRLHPNFGNENIK